MRLLIVGTIVAVTPFTCARQGLSLTAQEPGNGNPNPKVLLMGSGTLTTPNRTSKAITYNPDLAPLGAAITATLIPTSEDSTRADLTILGFLPNRSYVMDAHTRACGTTAQAAGPAFQDPPGITGIRLTVRTDTAGAGTSHTTVPFTLTDPLPRSIVLRAGTQTAAEPDQADARDTRGARLACLTLSRK